MATWTKVRKFCEQVGRTALGRILNYGLIFTALATPAFGSGITNELLVNDCANKAWIMNKKGDVVGYEIAGYCKGYIESAVHTLSIDKNCGPQEPPTPQRLLSIYETFMTDFKIAPGDNAAKTLRSAYTRAFDCGK